MSASLITLPTSSCVASVNISLTRTVARTESPFTLETQSFLWQGEQWRIDFQLPPIVSRTVAGEWKAFGAKMKGSYNYFLLGDPSATTPMGVATGTPVVSAGSQTGNSLQTGGWSNSTTNIMRAGDYIQIGSGTGAQLYMVTANVNSDSSGNATLSIEPALRSSPALNAPITVNSPKGLFRLMDNTFSWDVTPGPRYNIAFSAVEVLNA